MVNLFQTSLHHNSLNNTFFQERNILFDIARLLTLIPYANFQAERQKYTSLYHNQMNNIYIHY